MNTMSRDPHHGNKGNALQAFYQKFTPAYIVSKVKDWINAKSNRMLKYAAFNAGHILNDLREAANHHRVSTIKM